MVEDLLHVMYAPQPQAQALITTRRYERDKKDEPKKLFALAEQLANHGFWLTPTVFVPPHCILRVTVELAGNLTP